VVVGVFKPAWFWLLCAGWSHFAQFTIAVVNKDPKKSKYSGEQQWFKGSSCIDSTKEKSRSASSGIGAIIAL
jgi:hypothetical protein